MAENRRGDFFDSHCTVHAISRRAKWKHCVTASSWHPGIKVSYFRYAISQSHA